MKISRKILVFPLILITTFGVAYYALTYFNFENQKLLLKTKNVYLPCVEKSITIHHNLFVIQKALQDAVSSAETDKLKNADSLASEFKILCRKGVGEKENQKYIDSIYTFFDIYYSNASNLSKLMIEKDISEQMTDDISEMLIQYNTLANMIDRMGIRSKKQAENHFELVEKNNKKSATSNVLIVIIGLAISLLTSYFVSIAISKPLQILNKDLKENRNELRVFVDELSHKNDELTQKNIEIEVTLDKLKEAQSQLVEYEKMASIGMLSIGISHEINNPLNFIQGGKSAISNYIDENLPSHKPRLDPFISIIETGINRASAIVKSLNHFSRNSESFNEICDIHLIIENCLQILQNNLKNKVKVIKEFNQNAIIIKGNESKLHQVFMNILQNAEQSIETDGQIKITTTKDYKNSTIIISDNGCGISKQNLSKVIEPFFTTKLPGQGTGLGLSITSNIIKEHNGFMEINSVEGKGTEVIIILPKSK